MSNVEHLIENALVAMQGRDDAYQAFCEAMGATYNQQMLEEVNMTEHELWMIAQYVTYVWRYESDG